MTREFLNKLSEASSSGPAGSVRPTFARAMTLSMTSWERKLGREVEGTSSVSRGYLLLCLMAGFIEKKEWDMILLFSSNGAIASHFTSLSLLFMMIYLSYFDSFLPDSSFELVERIRVVGDFNYTIILTNISETTCNAVG